MDGSYSAEDRRALSAAVAREEELSCPACGAVVLRHDVDAGPGVPYARRRVLLVCPGCRRSAAVDVPRRGRG